MMNTLASPAPFFQATPANTPIACPQQWILDIAEHSDLVIECHELARQQTAVMERIRLAKAASDQTVTVRVVGDQVEISDGAWIADEQVELSTLDARLQNCKNRMRQLEGAVLTYQPKNQEEVAMVLKFLASVMVLDHKIPADYVASVLEDCFDACLTQDEQISTAMMH